MVASVEIPTMVSRTSTHVGGLHRLITETEMMVKMMVNRDNSLMQPQLAIYGASQGEMQRSAAFKGSTERTLSTWRTKTTKSYDSLFAKWHRCSEQSSDPWESWWVYSGLTSPDFQACKRCLPSKIPVAMMFTNLGCSEGTKLSRFSRR